MIKDIKEYDKFIDKDGNEWGVMKSTVHEGDWILYDFPECPSYRFQTLEQIEQYLNREGMVRK